MSIGFVRCVGFTSDIFFTSFHNSVRTRYTLNNVFKGNVTVRIMDITGRQVYRHVFNNVMNQMLPVDISNEPSNLYFITISDAHNTVVKKFMKR